MTDAAAPDAAPAEVRRAGAWVFAAGVALLCVWVLVPIYLLFVNALSAPAEVQGFPKSLLPLLRPRLAVVLRELPGRRQPRSGTRSRPPS